MRNFKKLVAMFGIVAMVGTIVSPTAFAQVDYGTEVVAGYDYAFANDVTTVDTIDAANPYGLATREQAAKQFVNIAKAINPAIVADDTAECAFVDLGNADASLVPFITEVCEMGIMGQNMPEMKFLPFNTVDRAQVATMLSRIIWGDKYDGGTPWYAAHMEALKDAGIMTNISNPNAPTARYEIWLMAQRTDDANIVDVLPEECQDPMVQLSCALGLGEPDCPAVCTPSEEEEEEEEDVIIEETAGMLDVSMATTQPEKYVAIDVPAVEVGTFTFNAGTDEDVILDSISMEALGYGDYNNLDDVALYDDRGVKVTRERNVDGDGEVEVGFINGYTLKAGGSMDFTVVAKIISGTNGDTYGFKVVDIDGPVSINGLPIETQLVVASIVNNMGTLDIRDDAQATAAVKVGADEKFGGFELSNANEEEDITLYSIVLDQNGTVDADNIKDLYIVADGEILSDENVLYDGDTITIAFDDGYTLPKTTDARVEFEIRGVIQGFDSADTVGFQIEDEEDVVAKGDKFGFRTAIDAFVTTDLTEDVNGNGVLIEGADILSSFDKSEVDNTTKDAENVHFGTLNLEATSANYELVDYTIVLTVNGNTGTTLQALGISDVELGGDSYTDDLVAVAGDSVTLTFENIMLDQSIPKALPLTVDFDEATAGNTYSFDLSFGDATFELEDLDNDITYTTEAGAKEVMSAITFDTRSVEVKAGGLAVDVTAMNTQEVILGNGVLLTMGLGEFEADDTADVDVRKVKFDMTGSVTDVNGDPLVLDDIVSSAQLFVDGTPYNDSSITNTTITFDDDFTLDASEDVAFELIVILKEQDLSGAVANEFALEFSVLDFRVDSEDYTIVDAGNPSSLGGMFTLLDFGSIAISIDTTEDDQSAYTNFTDVSKTVVAGSSDVVLAKIKLNADKEDISIRDLFFAVSGSSLEDIDSTFYNFRMVSMDDATSENGTLSGEYLTFDDIDYVVDENTIQYAFIVADVKGIDPDGTITTAVTGASLDLTLSVGPVNDDSPRVIGEVSDEDSDEETTMLVLDTTITSNSTIVAANVPTVYTMTAASFAAGAEVVVAEFTVTLDSQSINKDADGELLDAYLAELNVTVAGYGGNAAINPQIRKKGGSTGAVALTNGVLIPIDLGDDGEINPGTAITFEILADVDGAGDNPSTQTRIANIASDVVLDDGTGYSVTITVGGGMSQDLSVSAK